MFASTLRRLPRLPQIAGAAALILLVQPAAAADFQIDNLKLDLGAVVIAAPKVAVKGSPLEREAFVSIFNGATGESAVARMSRLNAEEISAPELTVEQTIGPQKQVTVYRDIRFAGIREGRIGRGETSGGTIKVTGGEIGQMSGEMKRMSIETLDLRQIARVLSERAAPGKDEPLVTVFGRFEQDGYTLDMGPVGKMSLGKSSGRDFKARVGSEPLADLFGRIMAQAEAQQKAQKDPTAKRDTEDDKRLALAMFSLFDNFDYGSGEVRDMAMNMSAPPKPGAAPVKMEMKVARIAYGEDAPAKSGMVMEGFSFAGDGAKGTIDSLSYSGFSFGPVLKELQALLAKPEKEALESIDYRKLIPTLGTIRLTGLAVEAPQPVQPGQAPRAKPAEPIRVGLGAFEIKAGEQLNGIPTSLALSIDKLTAPVVANGSNDAALRDLIAMGYKVLDLSAKLDLAWTAASNELAIRTLSFGGAGMGQFEASGTLGNVTKDLFSSDLALAQIAALGATARNVQAKLQNLGLFEKLIENEARKAGRKPEEVKRQYAMMASLGLAAILGPSDGAKTLSAAIARFVAQPGTLTVQASAKSTSGLGLADVIAVADPTEIFDKLDIKANAQ